MTTVAAKQRPSTAVNKKPLLGSICPLLADGTGDVKTARPVRSTLDVKGALGDGANISRNIMILKPVLGAFVRKKGSLSQACGMKLGGLNLLLAMQVGHPLTCLRP